MVVVVVVGPGPSLGPVRARSGPGPGPVRARSGLGRAAAQVPRVRSRKRRRAPSRSESQHRGYRNAGGDVMVMGEGGRGEIEGATKGWRGGGWVGGGGIDSESGGRGARCGSESAAQLSRRRALSPDSDWMRARARPGRFGPGSQRIEWGSICGADLNILRINLFVRFINAIIRDINLIIRDLIRNFR